MTLADPRQRRTAAATAIQSTSETASPEQHEYGHMRHGRRAQVGSPIGAQQPRSNVRKLATRQRQLLAHSGRYRKGGFKDSACRRLPFPLLKRTACSTSFGFGSVAPDPAIRNRIGCTATSAPKSYCPRAEFWATVHNIGDERRIRVVLHR